MEDLRRRFRRLLLDPGPAGTAATGTITRSSEAEFEANMVIVLAALLIALICVLGINSIVRCALRCGRRFAFGSPDEDAAAGMTAAGMEKSALRRIPVAVFGSGVDIPATDCPICLGDFADGEKVRVLPTCRHGFHVSCIDTWLLSHSSCPTCRRSLLENPPACSESDDGGGGIRQLPAPGHGGDVPVNIDEVG